MAQDRSAEVLRPEPKQAFSKELSVLSRVLTEEPQSLRAAIAEMHTFASRVEEALAELRVDMRADMSRFAQDLRRSQLESKWQEKRQREQEMPPKERRRAEADVWPVETIAPGTVMFAAQICLCRDVRCDLFWKCWRPRLWS